MARPPLSSGKGVAWTVEAFGCPAERLKDRRRLSALFRQAVRDLGLHPVGPSRWHRFPAPGGITGFRMLRESHLAVHTFPEFGSACLDLFCCRPRPDFDWAKACRKHLGARRVRIRRLRRPYARA